MYCAALQRSSIVARHRLGCNSKTKSHAPFLAHTPDHLRLWLKTEKQVSPSAGRRWMDTRLESGRLARLSCPLRATECPLQAILSPRQGCISPQPLCMYVPETLASRSATMDQLDLSHPSFSMAYPADAVMMAGFRRGRLSERNGTTARFHRIPRWCLGHGRSGGRS